jgi:phosphoglycolate phosphatase-like HAD superfamily hydrolase
MDRLTTLAARWERAKTGTQEYLHAMPAEHLGFRPAPEARGFAEQFLYLGWAMLLPRPGATTRLAVLDIDGTLTATTAVDEACYFRAAAAVYGPAAAGADWAAAPHVTDSGLAHWLADAHLGRPPRADELDAHRARFVALLQAELARDPAQFAPVPGAPGLLDALRSGGWHVALATGGWGASARLKLRAAGLADDAVPLASADDGLSREAIVRAAAERAGAPLERWGRAVSVGDGAWDVRTAAALGLPFVGVGTGPRATALFTAGAAVVLPDLQDRTAVDAALAGAPVPRPPPARAP